MDYIKKIHNTVFVSDRIITYKSAAALLDVNVNEAKKYLEDYVHNTESKNEIIHVSYVIGGLTLTDHNKVKIIPQNKYNEAKTQFKTLSINHIYSIQKAPLTDWVPVFNVDDLLYDKNETPPEPEVVKQEVITKPAQKKGGISNFLNNTNKTKPKQKQPPKTIETTKPKKQENNSVTNFLSKNNKENVNGNIVEEINDSDEEDIIKVNKKRARVLNDEDEEENEIPAKCAKVDILDDPVDEEQEEYHSDEDIFGSPEKDEELMKDSEESVIETNTEESTERSETMYEDDDGYFVTDKKKTSKQVPDKNLNKKPKEEKKQEKKNKKETIQKIKTNTNQKSILNFFQKKM